MGVVGVASGSHFSSPQAVTSSVVAPVQLNQIAVVPPREECAKIGVNCAAQKCCKVTGYECYEVKPGMAKCMKECTPGKDGTCFHHTVPMKVDADAVFLPTRLRDYLGKVEVTENGIYLENCKYVSYGFFGSLEVLSHTAASTYMANLDDCKTSLNYLGREKLYGNEPWGEDLFAQRCMDLHGVDKVSAFD